MYEHILDQFLVHCISLDVNEAQNDLDSLICQGFM